MNDLKEKILQGTLKSLKTVGIDNLKKIIRNSEEEKREQGLLFCGNTDIPPFGEISHSDLCIGTECNVEIKDCKSKKRIGMFHTHPHTEMSKNIGNLSGEDIYHTVRDKQNFNCIGLTEKDKTVLSDKSEKHKPIIKCFIPAFDINALTAMKSYMKTYDYHKKISDYNLSENKPDGTKKSLEELSRELPQDKRKILYNSYVKMLQADDELFLESKDLATKLLFKDADLIIK